jgi:hypothetical protein
MEKGGAGGRTPVCCLVDILEARELDHASLGFSLKFVLAACLYADAVTHLAIDALDHQGKLQGLCSTLFFCAKLCRKSLTRRTLCS